MINVTMMAGLVLVVFGFMTWALVAEFLRVREIYDGLTSDQQQDVHRFITTSLLMAVMLVSLKQVVARWIKPSARRGVS